MLITFLLSSANFQITKNLENKHKIYSHNYNNYKKKYKIKIKKASIKKYKIKIHNNKEFLFNFNRAMYYTIHKNKQLINLVFLNYYIKNYYKLFSKQQQKNININLSLLLHKYKTNKLKKNWILDIIL